MVPLVHCMHTQSLVGHAQVDYTLLQAARHVNWHNKAVVFVAYSFERVVLRDDCFVAMLLESTLLIRSVAASLPSFHGSPTLYLPLSSSNLIVSFICCTAN